MQLLKMAEKEKDIRDDEFRIIGQSAQVSGDNPRRSNRAIAIVSAILVIAIGALVIWKWPKSIPEDPNNGVFDGGNTSVAQEPVLRPFGQETDKAFTEKIDTIINDIPLTLYIPHNATAELSVGKPNIHDKDIILIAQAADIRGDNYKILGAFVLKGKPLAWGLSKKGFCAIINEEMTVGTSENSPLFEKATETDGYFFRQFSLVNEGVLVENELKNKSIRKALCSRLGENFIAVTETPESFHDFAQALVDLGVENAIALVGSSSAFGWYIDENGNQTLFGEDIHKYKNENYILWKH